MNIAFIVIGILSLVAFIVYSLYSAPIIDDDEITTDLKSKGGYDPKDDDEIDYSHL